MSSYSIETCSKLDALNKALVEGEINFSRTVLFNAEIDLTEIEKLRAVDLNNRPTYTAFIAKAIALALLDFPYANRRLFYTWGLPFFSFFQTFRQTDIAIAIERNVENFNSVAYIEIIRDVHKMSLLEISSLLRQFSTSDLNSSKQWRSFYNLGMYFPFGIGGRLARIPWFFPRLWRKYRGGAVMISSPAKYGVDGIVAAWSHPLSFSFGLAQKKPMVKNDQIVAVQAFTFVMNWDRRIMAGAQAARFFARICDLLRDPKELTTPK